MARQIATDDELRAAASDFDTFRLPIDASLNLGTFGAYGTTDTSLALSLTNVRYIENTRRV